MKKVFLEVPKSDSIKVKELGAQWDKNEKKWFIPHNLDKVDFKRWIPNYGSGDIIKLKTPIYLVKTWVSCYECGHITDVFCLASQGIIDRDSDLDMFFTIQELSYVQDNVLEILKKHAPNYLFTCTEDNDVMHMLNHCSKCGAVQADHNLHHPEGPFAPHIEENAKEVTLYELPLSNNIKVSGSYCTSDIALIYHCAKREQLHKQSL